MKLKKLKNQTFRVIGLAPKAAKTHHMPALTPA
jgi:hypothetical protein